MLGQRLRQSKLFRLIPPGRGAADTQPAHDLVAQQQRYHEQGFDALGCQGVPQQETVIVGHIGDENRVPSALEFLPQRHLAGGTRLGGRVTHLTGQEDVTLLNRHVDGQRVLGAVMKPERCPLGVELLGNGGEDLA